MTTVNNIRNEQYQQVQINNHFLRWENQIDEYLAIIESWLEILVMSSDLLKDVKD